MKHKQLLINLIFAVVVLGIAGGWFAWRAAHRTGAAALAAALTYGDAIQVQDGAARFVDSPCPDHICEHYGWLREEDQTATCLPARAVLTIVPVS